MRTKLALVNLVLRRVGLVLVVHVDRTNDSTPILIELTRGQTFDRRPRFDPTKEPCAQ